VFSKTISSPVGKISLLANESSLLSLKWGEEVTVKHSESNSIIEKAESQLEEYFSGKRFAFDIPLAPQGTAFQQLVWQQLLKISYGERMTYGEQARLLERPKAARAVGAANGKNPIGIIIPCHRVIGATGHLTGFAGGLRVKQQLLELEGFRF
jgi:methylated-DNA-[protein]-cysteine S-methyltransferase